MYKNKLQRDFCGLWGRKPQAIAIIKGGDDNPDIRGSVRFYQTYIGTLVVADVSGLPKGKPCGERIFGFHIHEGESCDGTHDEPFSFTRSHYDPNSCPHPYHAGDMPPLFGADGYAFLTFLSNRFTIEEIIGRTVVIHDAPDDFTTQPSGNAGKKIACGKIQG